MEQTVDRSTAGQFVKGHSVKSPGRPRKPKAEQIDHLSLLRQAMTEGESLEIIRAAIAQAKTGSRHARQWLFSYLMPQFPRLTQYEFSLLDPNCQVTISSGGVYDDEDGIADDVYRAAMAELSEDELIALNRFDAIRRKKRLELRASAQTIPFQRLEETVQQ